MQIIITKVINRLTLIRYISIIERCGLKEAQRKVDAISNGIKQSIDVPDKYLTQFKTACEFTIESKRYNMEKQQFKPFDQVLVRDNDTCNWKIGIYSHYEEESTMPYKCVGSQYEQCIPYNENTAHLVGTNEPYKKPEPKVWRISSHGDNPENLTDEELSHFIRNAVILNKDITDVHIRYIGK